MSKRAAKRRQLWPGHILVLLLVVVFSGCATTAADVPGKPGTWLVAELGASENAELRLAIVREMAHRRDPTLMRYLCSATGDPDARIRQAGMDGLVEYGGAFDDENRDLSYLRGLEDRVHTVRGTALAGVRARLANGRRPQTLISHLTGSAQSADDYRMRLASVRVLTAVEGDDIDELLMDRARKDEHSEVRRAAAGALGTRGVKAARRVLNHLRNQDMNKEVRIAAEEALGKIGGMISEHVLVVMPFDTRSQQGKVQEFAAGLQDFLSSALAQASLATIVERRQIARAMDELVFQDDHIDDGRAVEVGRFLRADQVLTGTVQLNGSEVTIIAKRIDVVSGAIVQSIQVHGRMHDADALQQDVAHQIVRTFE